MAKKATIKAVERVNNQITVTYDSGTVRTYSADNLPKTVKAWIDSQADQAEAARPETRPEPEQSAPAPIPEAQQPIQEPPRCEMPEPTEAPETPTEPEEPRKHKIAPTIAEQPTTVQLHRQEPKKRSQRPIAVPEPERVRVSPIPALQLAGLFVAGVGIYFIWWIIQGCAVAAVALEWITGHTRPVLQRTAAYIAHNAPIWADQVKTGYACTRKALAAAWAFRAEIIAE